MQKTEDDIANSNLYSNLLNKHGDDFRSLNWGSKQSQLKRFEVLGTIANLNYCSILDVGCGLSHFYEWLNNQGIEVEYHGLDITPEMIIRSRNKFPSASFRVGSILDDDYPSSAQYDYVFASGLFYFRIDNPKDYLALTISKMFSIAKKGIAFNCLSTWSEEMAKDEFYADPIDVISYCKSLTSKIILQHHYHPADFTIILYK